MYESESYSEESDQESGKSSAKLNKEPENPKTKTNQAINNTTTTTKKKAKTQSNLGSFFKKLK